MTHAMITNECETILDRSPELIAAGERLGRGAEVLELLAAVRAVRDSSSLTVTGRLVLLSPIRRALSEILYPDQPTGAGAGEPTGWEIVPT